MGDMSRQTRAGEHRFIHGALVGKLISGTKTDTWVRVGEDGGRRPPGVGVEAVRVVSCWGMRSDTRQTILIKSRGCFFFCAPAMICLEIFQSACLVTTSLK